MSVDLKILNSTNSQKYDSIQLMRAVAALSVIFVHIAMFSNDWFGVDLFFCISGFIMMHITEQRNSAKFFLRKRAIRIIPLYWIATLLISALIIIKPDVFRTQEFRFEFLIKSMLFIPYYFTAQNGRTVNLLLEVGWTLICEVFFYLLFFISIKISHKYRQVIATILLLVEVTLGFIVKKESTFIRFYCRPFMLEFALGMFAFRFLQMISKIKINNGGLFLFFGIIAILIWSGLFAEKYLPYFSRIDRLIKYGVPSFTFFVIIFKIFEQKKVPRIFITLGDISYSLYITHSFVVQGFSRIIYNIDDFTIIGSILVILIVLPACICVAWVSWLVIENVLSSWLRKKLNI